MSKILVLNPFTIDAEVHSDAHSIACSDPSLTIQADAAQADINNIVRQFGITHELPYGEAVPVYDDYSEAPTDYHAAMNYIRDTDELFMKFPASVRTKFDNDTSSFLSFVDNPDNYNEAISMGLIPTPPASDAGGVVPPASETGGDKP